MHTLRVPPSAEGKIRKGVPDDLAPQIALCFYFADPDRLRGRFTLMVVVPGPQTDSRIRAAGSVFRGAGPPSYCRRVHGAAKDWDLSPGIPPVKGWNCVRTYY